MPTIFYNTENRKSLRKKLRKSMPKGEILLWQKLKTKQLGYKFRRQYGVGPFVLDFYCREIRLGIEVDGLTHDHTKQVVYDRERQKYLEAKKIKIIRFNSEEIFKDTDNVVERIFLVCQKLKKLPPPTPSL
jgi:very-short-patch-repair endonuclease